MRWLMIGLFVSLVGLLIAVGGMVRHVWIQRRMLRQEAPAEPESATEIRAETES
jgi:hypothetical protein